MDLKIGAEHKYKELACGDVVLITDLESGKEEAYLMTYLKYKPDDRFTLISMKTGEQYNFSAHSPYNLYQKLIKNATIHIETYTAREYELELIKKKKEYDKVTEESYE